MIKGEDPERQDIEQQNSLFYCVNLIETLDPKYFFGVKVKGEARDNLISSLLGTWLNGGVGRDLLKGVWIKGHDVWVDSDFLLIQGGVGRDSFKGVGIKGHEVWVDSDFSLIRI